MTEQPKPVSGKAIFGWLLVATFVVYAWASHGQPSSGSDYCSDLWNQNRATAESSYMTQDRYIANCEQTNDDLRSGAIPVK